MEFRAERAVILVAAVLAIAAAGPARAADQGLQAEALPTPEAATEPVRTMDPFEAGTSARALPTPEAATEPVRTMPPVRSPRRSFEPSAVCLGLAPDADGDGIPDVCESGGCD